MNYRAIGRDISSWFDVFTDICGWLTVAILTVMVVTIKPADHVYIIVFSTMFGIMMINIILDTFFPIQCCYDNEDCNCERDAV
jgi:hypothetical protein